MASGVPTGVLTSAKRAAGGRGPQAPASASGQNEAAFVIAGHVDHRVDGLFGQVLPDGDQCRDYGLMSGLTRLPVKGRDILIFSNIESPQGRHHGTVWASFDGGRTWPVKRLVYDGPSAYSNLGVGRTATPSQGKIYLIFEGGPTGCYEAVHVASFNLSGLLDGRDVSRFLSKPRWRRP